jgi:rare lipoprotein A (peptidoglycan hydrolase)
MTFANVLQAARLGGLTLSRPSSRPLSLSGIIAWGVSLGALGLLGLMTAQSCEGRPAVAPAVKLADERRANRTLSTYSAKYEGRLMANGKPYRASALTVASNDWKLGTRLTLQRVDKFGQTVGSSLTVTVTDRMHRRFNGRRIDASRSVWDYLSGKAIPGLIRVRVTNP